MNSFTHLRPTKSETAVKFAVGFAKGFAIGTVMQLAVIGAVGVIAAIAHHKLED